MYRDHPRDKVRRTQRQWQHGLLLQRSAVARLRGCRIFLPMSVVPAEDADGGSSAATFAPLASPASATTGTEEEPQEVPVGGSTNLGNGDHGEVYHAERLLYNGDFYAGTWSGNLPHGTGKYLWIDGCMYEGEWRHGNTSGRGKFSWPSGATYEGEFRCGFMDGVGTYTASSGDTYHGSWTMNLKHGWGKKSYSNGDSYEGEWRRGVQHGRGRYVWSNGNEYTGSWKAGTIHGRGVLTWANGNCYDGDWEGGMPSGMGRFRWVDGSCYVGVWRKGVGVEEGVYHGSRASAAGGRRTCRGEEEPVGSAGGSQLVTWVSRGMKKPGETIEVGHKNYELMLCLQLGIRHSVGRPAPVATLDLKASSFDPKEKLWTRFPPEGTKYTPSHQSSEFKWKDYCPVVFRTLRKLFKIDAADYMMSICGNDALRELPSPGKSGSLFYLTHDDRYMIKTIRKSEVKVLLRMLPAYYNHVRGFESTLVTKFFGLHCVKLTGPMQRKVRFIVMGNVFYSEYSVHRRFDLKGSSHGRITDKSGVEIDETSTLKDRDLNFTFWLPKTWFHEFQRQLDRDREFLEREWLMDYSLLVGVHFRATSMPGYPWMPKDVNDLNGTPGEAIAGLPRSGIDKRLPDPPRRAATIKLGVNMPARVQHTVVLQRGDCDPPQLNGEPTGETFDAVLFLGIIDILQDYGIGKRLEHAYKSFQCDPTSISAVDPKHYSRRFRDFVFKVFREDSL